MLSFCGVYTIEVIGCQVCQALRRLKKREVMYLLASY